MKAITVSGFLVFLIGCIFLFVAYSQQKEIREMQVKHFNQTQKIASLQKELDIVKRKKSKNVQHKAVQAVKVGKYTCLRILEGHLDKKIKRMRNKEFYCLYYKMKNTVKKLIVRACNSRRSHQWSYIISDKHNMCTTRKQLERYKKGYVHFSKSGRLYSHLRHFVYQNNHGLYYLDKGILGYHCQKGFRGNIRRYGYGVCRKKTTGLRISSLENGKQEN